MACVMGGEQWWHLFYMTQDRVTMNPWTSIIHWCVHQAHAMPPNVVHLFFFRARLLSTTL